MTREEFFSFYNKHKDCVLNALLVAESVYPRSKSIFEMYYFKGMSGGEISKVYNFNISRTYQINRRTARIIRHHLGRYTDFYER